VRGTGPGAELGIGLEGGAVVVDREREVVLLRNWAAATDGKLEWIGSGPGVQLPTALARAVLAGEELATAVDRYANASDVRSGRGAFGVITGDRITRAEAFTAAILTALAPWYHPAR
jgi:non-canonical (house-cleaning) NTP pyrophosphatase